MYLKSLSKYNSIFVLYEKYFRPDKAEWIFSERLFLVNIEMFSNETCGSITHYQIVCPRLYMLTILYIRKNSKLFCKLILIAV